MKGHNPKNSGFYGPYARFLLLFARSFTRKKHYIPPTLSTPAEGASFPSLPASGPAVYVCRHLNMHGPYSCIKWLPFSFHPMILDVFFDRKTAKEHLLQFTFSVRVGKPAGQVPLHYRFVAWLAGIFLPPLVRSLQAVPVHRDNHSYSTLKTGLNHLLKGEPLALWPDIAYTAPYGKEGEIYRGFLYLGELYRKRTGQSLPFIPLVVDDENRCLTAGPPIFCDCFREENDAAAEALKHAINGTQMKAVSSGKK